MVSQREIEFKDNELIEPNLKKEASEVTEANFMFASSVIDPAA